MNSAELARRRCSLAGRPTEVLQAHAEECGLVAPQVFQKHELVERILSLEPPVSRSPGPLRRRNVRPIQGASNASDALNARRRCSLAERPLDVLQAHAEECGLNYRRLQKKDLIENILVIEPSSFQSGYASGQASQLGDADLARQLAEEELSSRRATSAQAQNLGTLGRSGARSEPYPTRRSPRVAESASRARKAPIPRRLEESTATMIYAGSDCAPECSVCMEVFESGQELRMLPCMHRYHRSCIDKWLRQNAACPLCKHEVKG